MGHHYAIWASDSNILLALISGTENVLKIAFIIVNINKDENKSLISNQFSLKNDL
jgi:hypothetical protein